MSDVSPSAKVLRCSFCGHTCKQLAGLSWHMQHVHRTLRLGKRKDPVALPVASAPALPSGRAMARADVPAAHSASRNVGGPVGAVGGKGQAGGTPSATGEDGFASDGAVTQTGSADSMAGAESNLAARLELTRRQSAGGPPPKRQRVGRGAAASTDIEYEYSTLSTAVRAHFERINDKARAVAMVEPRTGWRPGAFDSFRLRTLQRYVSECNMSAAELARFYQMMSIWDGTCKSMPIDHGHGDSLQDVFSTFNSFRSATKDAVDYSLMKAGWLKCTLEEDGFTFHAFFRPVLEMAIKKLLEAERVMMWSGVDKPAAATNRRETPMDGDAFRLNEKEVYKLGENCFVLAFYVFSDASQLSWSGGKSAACLV